MEDSFQTPPYWEKKKTNSNGEVFWTGETLMCKNAAFEFGYEQCSFVQDHHFCLFFAFLYLKYRVWEPRFLSMASREPMPRYFFSRMPSEKKYSPGASLVAASREPIITEQGEKNFLTLNNDPGLLYVLIKILVRDRKFHVNNNKK